MDLEIENLKKLLRSSNNDIITDAVILSCGCIGSETIFNREADAFGMAKCVECGTKVTILRPLPQLRELYNIIKRLEHRYGESVKENEVPKSRRRSSSKKSFKINDREQLDLISLFYKYAKEETEGGAVGPIDIKRPNSIHSHSTSPNKKYSPEDSFNDLRLKGGKNSIAYEDYLLSSLSEEKEYNFSKCFPFHRKLTTFQTQQKPLFNTPFLKTSIKKTSRFTSSHIHTTIDRTTNEEITRFVLITEKKWELYELSGTDQHPIFVCCGKSSGEYGPSPDELKQDYGHEVVIRNEFSNTDVVHDVESGELKKKLSSWEQLTCQINDDFLVITGTKGLMRVFNISRDSLPHEMGKPVYTYTTDFPIRCVAISPNDPLIACSITAKERVTGKEQPFVIVHKLIRSNVGNKIIGSVEPITITIPYRDPIKILNFNAASTHLICCTVWEGRYSIIRLRSLGSDNFRKPRLIWTDSNIVRNSKRKKSDGMVLYDDSEDEDKLDEDALMMDNEGITDAQFGSLPNTVIISSCSLQNRPVVMLRLEGSSIGSSFNRNLDDNLSLSSSRVSNPVEDEYDIGNIKSADLLVKFPEIGSSIHKLATSPRRDALVFLDKDGKLYLVSIANHKLSLTTPIKKVVVLLGEVSNAERFTEAASIKFSADGGKVYVVDRRGNFSMFDFTKGVPGHDSDVVKCKIIM